MRRVLFLVFAFVAFGEGAPRNVRIIGGQDAAPGQFPFIVALNDPDQFCDGSIINKNWIVTAAHCLVYANAKTTVLVGTHTAHSGGKVYNINKTIINANYNPSNGQNDIGLVQLDGELQFDDMIQPIEFGDPEINATCTAAGWGVTESVDFPEVVQFVELTAIDLEMCKDLAQNISDYYLGSETLCTLAQEGKGACYGDSGGPLICDGKLAGIVSYGVMPCALGYPDVFTRPSAYAEWIEDQIQNS